MFQFVFHNKIYSSKNKKKLKNYFTILPYSLQTGGLTSFLTVKAFLNQKRNHGTTEF